MKLFKLAPLLAALAFSSAVAGSNYESSNLENSFFGGISYGFQTSGAKRSGGLSDLSEDSFPGFMAGYNDTDLRYYLSYDPLNLDGGSVKNLSLNIDYLYKIPEADRWHLYAGLNVGQNRFKDDTLGSERKASYGGQAGVIYRFSENTNFEFGYKHIDANGAEVASATQKSQLEDISGFRAGVTFNFPLAKKETTKSEMPPARPDFPKVVEADDDKDGIVNGKDKCPMTPKDFKVNNIGCEVGYEFMINFATDSAKIESEFDKSVQAFADFLKNNPAYSAVIEGHTDSRGTEKHNLNLSNNRAKSVVDRLVELGIDKNRLLSKGYGEEKPRVANDTPENMFKNRRVEARIVIK